MTTSKIILRVVTIENEWLFPNMELDCWVSLMLFYVVCVVTPPPHQYHLVKNDLSTPRPTPQDIDMSPGRLQEETL